MAWVKKGSFAKVALVRSPYDWFHYQEEKRANSINVKTANAKIAQYSPEDYIFTHNTIIASVDTDTESDWLITANTQKYINDNFDSWTRGVISNDWESFVGAENYLEHVQIPSQSKGKIVDAVLRDVGESLYVDILVATARKHSGLIRKIESGALNAMSMGCICAFTICSACGNRAVDETELCTHIAHFKGNRFIGPDGQQRIIAELCGHESQPGSVEFIEASWVANPAFRGAVTRNILGQREIEAAYNKSKIFVVEKDIPKKDAGTAKVAYETAIDDTIPEDVYFRDRVDRTEEDGVGLVDRAWRMDNQLSKEFGPDEEPKPQMPPLKLLEENIFQSSQNLEAHLKIYAESGFKGLGEKQATSKNILRVAKYVAARDHDVVISEPHLRAVALSGGVRKYPDEQAYLAKISSILDRKLVSSKEEEDFLRLGRLYDLGNSRN